MSTSRRAFLESFLVVSALALTIINVIAITGGLAQPAQFLTILFAGLIITLFPVLFLLLHVFQERKFYQVAVIGFQKSGKTTLITSLFGEAFARRLPINLTPRGSQTIERINKSLEMLKKGKVLGPTRDQDMFAFRADTTFGRFPFRTTYRIEFGDFPGKYCEEHHDGLAALHDTEFFKWLADSDAIVLVIDLGRYLLNVKARNDYVAKITSVFRAEWQQYLDANRYREKEVKRHPVIIVFSKTDLMYRTPKRIDLKDKEMLDSDEVRSIQRMVTHLGFSRKVPTLIEIDETQFKSDEKIIANEFAELINYFEAEVSNTDVVFTSSFGMLKGERLGLSKLILSVLKGAL